MVLYVHFLQTWKFAACETWLPGLEFDQHCETTMAKTEFLESTRKTYSIRIPEDQKSDCLDRKKRERCVSR